MIDVINDYVYRVEQKNFAKFNDTCSVRAYELCIGSPRLEGGRKAGKVKHARIFLHHAVDVSSEPWCWQFGWSHKVIFGWETSDFLILCTLDSIFYQCLTVTS